MARLPKSLIKKYGISKKAWSVFRSRRKAKTTRKTNPKRKVKKRMARRKRRRRGGKSMTQTAFKLIRLGAIAAPAVHVLTTHGSMDAKVDGLMLRYTGYSPKSGRFHPEYLMQGYGPYLASVLATYGIPKLAGILRRI